jgi:stage V sporulation protein AA
MGKTIYVRLRHRIQVRPNGTVKIGDVAQVIGQNNDIIEHIKSIVIYQISNEDKNIVVLDIIDVLKGIQSYDKSLEIQTMGPTQTLVEIVFEKKRLTPVFFILVWFLLFCGAALTIMNFHEDVSMREVHQKIQELITGVSVEKPLLFQIPYSLGLGLGMILFFNHLFKKRINEEPSPLEVEMFNYQQDLDRYMLVNEGKESLKRIDDD